MTVTEFTPFASALGGALIGIAAVMLMALNGRIAGISGIVGRLLPPYAGADPIGAACIVLGLIASPFLYQAATGAPFAQTVSDHGGLMAIAGLLVGFGTGYRRRLHQRTWGVRHRAAVAALAGRDGDLHGHRLRHGLCHAPCDRRLSHA